MDFTNALVIVAVALVLVILLNVGIYASFAGKKGKTPGTVGLLKNAFKRARNPWEDEDIALKQLSEIVTNLKRKDNSEGEFEE
jgi:hypothetical protein